MIVLIFVACFPLWLPALGRFLLVPDRLKPADSIVVLRGEDFFKMNKAVDLYEKGYAPKILVCALPKEEGEIWDFYQFKNKILGGEELSPKEFVVRAFRYFGLSDQKDLYVLEKDVRSTYDEAVAVRNWLLEQKVKSIILIADSYHMRRAWIIFKKVFKGTGIEIYPITASNPTYQPQTWWRSEKDVRRVLEEYVSLTFNILYHFVFRQKSTAFDAV